MKIQIPSCYRTVIFKKNCYVWLNVALQLHPESTQSCQWKHSDYSQKLHSVGPISKQITLVSFSHEGILLTYPISQGTIMSGETCCSLCSKFCHTIHEKGPSFCQATHLKVGKKLMLKCLAPFFFRWWTSCCHNDIAHWNTEKRVFQQAFNHVALVEMCMPLRRMPESPKLPLDRGNDKRAMANTVH
jgi:hypothetical protein